MQNRHPVSDLISDKIFQSVMKVDSLSMRNARLSQDKYITDDLISGIIKRVLQESNLDEIVRKSEDDGYNTTYQADLVVLSVNEMYNLMTKAFEMGADFQYKEMYRVLGEHLDRAEGIKNENSKTNAE